MMSVPPPLMFVLVVGMFVCCKYGRHCTNISSSEDGETPINQLKTTSMALGKFRSSKNPAATAPYGWCVGVVCWCAVLVCLPYFFFISFLFILDLQLLPALIVGEDGERLWGAKHLQNGAVLAGNLGVGSILGTPNFGTLGPPVGRFGAGLGPKSQTF